jgi:hypothetical protein
MGRFLPLCVLLLALLCSASLMNIAEGGIPGVGAGVGLLSGSTQSSSPRSLSGGTWAACVGSSLLATAAMLL